MSFKMRGPFLYIVGVYAPPSLRPVEEREQFNKDLTEVLDKIAYNMEVLIIGDFSVRLHARR